KYDDRLDRRGSKNGRRSRSRWRERNEKRRVENFPDRHLRPPIMRGEVTTEPKPPKTLERETATEVVKSPLCGAAQFGLATAPLTSKPSACQVANVISPPTEA